MHDFILALTIGYILDRILGDPLWLFHPICLIGNFISYMEKKLLKETDNEDIKYKKGVFLWFSTMLFTVLVFGGILYFASLIDELLFQQLSFFEEVLGFTPRLYLIALIIMSYQILATKSLADSSKFVYTSLGKGVSEGRKAVSMIVGRDTSQLDEEGIIKAAVETVAENTNDGVIAPMIFMAIGGPVVAFIYKAVNTLDSMVGYKSDKYKSFGKFSAILDDIFNFIPARIAAFFMIIASFTLGYDGKGAIRIFKRDRFNHASPNSAQTESVCAGALRIRLAGDAYYFGKLYKKDFIGDNVEKIEKGHIIKANKLMYRTSFIFLAFILAVFGIITYII